MAIRPIVEADWNEWARKLVAPTLSGEPPPFHEFAIDTNALWVDDARRNVCLVSFYNGRPRGVDEPCVQVVILQPRPFALHHVRVWRHAAVDLGDRIPESHDAFYFGETPNLAERTFIRNAANLAGLQGVRIVGRRIFLGTFREALIKHRERLNL